MAKSETNEILYFNQNHIPTLTMMPISHIPITHLIIKPMLITFISSTGGSQDGFTIAVKESEGAGVKYQEIVSLLPSGLSARLYC